MTFASTQMQLVNEVIFSRYLQTAPTSDEDEKFSSVANSFSIYKLQEKSLSRASRNWLHFLLA